MFEKCNDPGLFIRNNTVVLITGVVEDLMALRFGARLFSYD